MRLLLVLTLLTPAPLIAQTPFTGLKHSNPNELGVAAAAGSGCALSDNELLDTVQGVLIRSRIKPVDYRKSTGFFGLNVAVECSNKTQAFDVRVDFMDNINGWPIRIGDGYGTFGTFAGNKSYLLMAVSHAVETAITDYLKANFDLAPK
jgi:hypothetical protein